jgi:hypothetical protein
MDGVRKSNITRQGTDARATTFTEENHGYYDQH